MENTAIREALCSVFLMKYYSDERKSAYRVLVGNPEGSRQFAKPRRRWDDNIKVNLRELGEGHGLDRSGSGQGQVAGSCKFGNEL